MTTYPLAVRRAAHWRAVAFLMFGVGWGANQFTPLLGLYRRLMHLPISTTDALFAAYAVGLVPGLVIGARAADRLGRRRLVCSAAVVSAGVSLILMSGVSMPVLLLAGRLGAGLVAGLVLTVGSAWIKELSCGLYDPAAPCGAGARRAALAVSAGLGAGPLAAAAVAQWSPDPLVMAYLPHVLIMAIAGPVVRRVPDTTAAPRPTVPGGAAGYVPDRDEADSRPRDTALSRAFDGRAARAPVHGRAGVRTWPVLRAILPAAPWVFAAPAIAYIVLPGVVVVRHLPILYAGVITGITLASGMLAQPIARRLEPRHPRLVAFAGLTATIVGLAVAAGVAATGRPLIAVVAAMILGCGHGLCFVYGLGEVARRAGPCRLTELTAVFYALAYAGMFAPYALALLGGFASMPVLLGGGALLAGCSLAVVTAGAWAY